MHAWTMTAWHQNISMKRAEQKNFLDKLKFSKLGIVLTMLSMYCRRGITAELKGKRTTVRPRVC